MMGLYSTALFLGEPLPRDSASRCFPSREATGVALALWAVVAVVAAAVLIPQMIHRPAGEAAPAAFSPPSDRDEPKFRALLGDPTALAVTALMGIQSMGYYAALTWIPPCETRAWTPTPPDSCFRTPHSPASRRPCFSRCWPRRSGPIGCPLRSPWTHRCRVPGPGHRARPGFLPLDDAPGPGPGIVISLSLSYILWRSPDANARDSSPPCPEGFGYLIAGLGPLSARCPPLHHGRMDVPAGRARRPLGPAGVRRRDRQPRTPRALGPQEAPHTSNPARPPHPAGRLLPRDARWHGGEGALQRPQGGGRRPSRGRSRPPTRWRRCPARSNSSWLPCSTIRPSSMTRMRSAWAAWDSRWATTTPVGRG